MRSLWMPLVIVGCGGEGGAGKGDGEAGGADAGLYHAIFYFNGSRCGDDGEGDEAWCVEGDRCEDEERALCAPVMSACDPPNAEEIYDAIFDFNGRICGTNGGDEAWCKEGDRCVDEAEAACAIVISS